MKRGVHAQIVCAKHNTKVAQYYVTTLWYLSEALLMD